MIEIKQKNECCGCCACMQKCPKQCIQMLEDQEGFLYPRVDSSLCINCHLCENVCPIINVNLPREPIECYAGYNPDREVRMNSSSGGIFTMFAESIIRDGGVVFGAKFDDNWNVCHGYTETLDGLVAFRGSKYVQSFIGETYKQAKKFLDSGRKVLFTGTPCQIAGLRFFLKKEYENLLTVDFICHGVPSPGVFRSYLQEEINNYVLSKYTEDKVFLVSKDIPYLKKKISLPGNLKIINICFRDKCEGWRKYGFSIRLAIMADKEKHNSVVLSTNVANNSFLKGFLNDLYLRPSCYNCHFKSLSSGADITIADYWRVERIHPRLDDDMGVSAIIINTEKGRGFCQVFSKNWVVSDIDFIRKYNSALVKSVALSEKRSIFFQCWKNDNFSAIIRKLCKKTFLQILFCKLKVLYKLVKG